MKTEPRYAAVDAHFEQSGEKTESGRPYFKVTWSVRRQLMATTADEAIREAKRAGIRAPIVGLM